MNAVGHPQQGTIAPGTTIQLGRFTVVIDRYIAEGGFAHVYLANLGGLPVVVKRIAVADKERLAIVNSEIETMKRLGRHKNIVEYMDSCMGKLEGGGYEVLILMEYCGGGPVIDLMNRRLQHRLTEPEILKIFSNVCEAVAYMHYSDPPILHRDIKVENILLSNNDYKLCDFGSATTNILRGDNIPKNVKDIQLLEEEINNHTTLQYRAPEMLDLYMRRGIDEKIDIWALGVLLYKLCYYTTPFEEQGQLAILNARYTIPDHPVFTPGLINLFKSMLQEDAKQRPNIYQVMQVTSTMRGLPCPIQNKYKDIYIPPPQPTQVSATPDIFSKTVVARPVDVLPSIEPMRRGRPTRAQAASTPPPPAAEVVPEVNQVSSSKAPLSADFGFDDSFGQFAPADPSSQFSKIGALDPAAQFSKIPPSGDLFDFESSFKPASFGDSDKDAKKISSNTSTNFGQASALALDGFDLLKQQQMEQLDKFAIKPATPVGAPGSQGKAKVLDPLKTLDGLRSMDAGSRTGSSAGSAGNGFITTPPLAATNTSAPPPLAARPQALVSQVSSSSNYRAATPELPPLDRKELAQRDMEAELKLIQLQQKAFEQQQQELLALQRAQLEEQQRLHRAQQEKLQKQQQQQIQQQHEKWQERKRMMKEQELLSQKQLSQQQDLVQQHQSQQKLQQKQQQSLQLHASPSSSPSQLPAVSNLSASVASISLGNTSAQQLQNPYRRSVSGSSSQQSAGVVYPMTSGSSTHSADPLASLTSQYMNQSRPSLDNLRANFSGQSSIASSPAVSFNSITSPSANTSDSGTTPLLPSAPIKSARRTLDSGVSSSTISTPSSSSQPSASPVTASSAATRTRHRTSIPPPGQKPELLPKPTRFRMKDGAGSLAAGEEEAFRRKFPSADIDDEILSLTSSGNTLSPSSSSSFARENGVSGRESPAPMASLSNNSNSHYRLQQGRESPSFDAGVRTINSSGHSVPALADYRTPSQRARDQRAAHFGRNGSGREDDVDVEEDDEEEEEKLVRRRRPAASSTQQQPASPTVEDSYRSRTTANGSSPIKSATRPSQAQPSTRQDGGASPGVDDSSPAESVRERIQRMNRIGRVA
ncbi:AP2-associated kinase [Entomortierella parvispora]|uniref:non-specific serine/threonine protein kinase n=1 Tax=Entomortierella parvispora TaxID=205924 RepID=A0A9P3H3D6_9FUNG|nr:AP2-associated kinase [Entomortierella parvispora]